MNGIIIVDKPAGWTSHDVVAKLRGALKVKRVGHGGTLDPMATGVLVVFVGTATGAAQFSEAADKEYIASLRAGIVTDTQDITGNILSQHEASVTPEAISAVFKNFTGEQKQTPPMYSALKHKGKKLYELARKGIEVERQARDISIYEIKLINSIENEHSFIVKCSKGTYIRTLCHDIGAALGCGAAMSSLRRTASGRYRIDMARSMDDILNLINQKSYDELLLQTDTIFSEYPKLQLTEDDVKRSKNGQSCMLREEEDNKYRVYDHEGKFMLFGQIIEGELKKIKAFYGSN